MVPGAGVAELLCGERTVAGEVGVAESVAHELQPVGVAAEGGGCNGGGEGRGARRRLGYVAARRSKAGVVDFGTKQRGTAECEGVEGGASFEVFKGADVRREQECGDAFEGEGAGEPADEVEGGRDHGGFGEWRAGGEGVGGRGEIGVDGLEFGGEDIPEDCFEGGAFFSEVRDDEGDAGRLRVLLRSEV